MINQVPDSYLLPAFAEGHRPKIEAELCAGGVSDLVSAIKIINITVAGILDLELKGRLISTSFDFFIENCKKYYDAIISGKEGNIGINNFIRYINLLFLLLNVKKLYNTSPRDDFHDFYSLTCNTQLLRTVIPKGQDLPFLDITTGGSCHNYSILFKDFFDKLGIYSKVIFCNPVSNHSFLIIEVEGIYYQVDPLFNGKDFIKKVGIGDQIQIGFEHFGVVKSFSPHIVVEWFQIGNQENIKRSELVTYDDPEKFANMLDKRKMNYIIVENYLSSTHETFRLSFSRDPGEILRITVSLGSKEIEYKIKLNKFHRLLNETQIGSLSNEQIISLLITYLYGLKGKSQLLSLEIITFNISKIAHMIKRNDLITLLSLKESVLEK